MQKKQKLFILIFLLFNTFLFSENAFGKQIFSVDTSFLVRGIDNFGWEINASYEREIFRWFSLRAGFGHSTLWYLSDDLTLTSVSVSGEALCYPFARGLDWLYLGAQCKTGFFMYNGDDFNEENNQDTVISIAPIIGWKQTFAKSIMVDAFVGYRFVLNPGNQNPLIEEHVKNSIEYGIRFKIDLLKLINYSIEKLMFPLR